MALFDSKKTTWWLVYTPTAVVQQLNGSTEFQFVGCKQAGTPTEVGVSKVEISTVLNVLKGALNSSSSSSTVVPGGKIHGISP